MTALIAASKYMYVHVCVSGEGECVYVCGCDCVGVGVIVWVVVGVIAWVRKGMCGWDSLYCCLKVHTCMCVLGEGSACVGWWVGMCGWVWV